MKKSPRNDYRIQLLNNTQLSTLRGGQTTVIKPNGDTTVYTGGGTYESTTVNGRVVVMGPDGEVIA